MQYRVKCISPLLTVNQTPLFRCKPTIYSTHFHKILGSGGSAVEAHAYVPHQRAGSSLPVHVEKVWDSTGPAMGMLHKRRPAYETGSKRSARKRRMTHVVLMPTAAMIETGSV